MRESAVAYVIAMPCVALKDRAYVEECPVGAIFYGDDLPEQWKDYQAANAEFLDGLGPTGGAFKVGALQHDHPLIAALQSQHPAS